MLYWHYFWRQPRKVDVRIPVSQMMKVKHGRLSISALKLLIDWVATLPLAWSQRPAPFFLANCLSTNVARSHSTSGSHPTCHHLSRKSIWVSSMNNGSYRSLSRILCLARSSAWGWKPITTIWSTKKQQFNVTTCQAQVLWGDIYKTPWAVIIQRA